VGLLKEEGLGKGEERGKEDKNCIGTRRDKIPYETLHQYRLLWHVCRKAISYGWS
jgi:hypothetical protein